ncbi:homoserine acetyltransferase family protein [Cucurbitaria berberidis CBS 394.84]|uniref:Homoserine acetyltransferase family protein n=1 Tax=Cucurbitaria berberidis CBS 394.84 TaxID=1168544 RepID=A0A9P4GJ50_9PLEO|nr:homoserine acetyltransferase family protein [Cucurbitaria berberidis CBS 394.84]KAF1846116.1 homoserine acetyltransferase family protein [Cucurbitaria berberidis CBS 394.84]
MASTSSEPPIQYFDIPDFTFHNGTTLPHVRIAYQVLNPQNTKVAVIHSCFRGKISSTVTHSRGALSSHKIIVIALFGNGESASPSNTPNFARTIEYMDCVAAQHRLLSEHLGIKEVDVMMGFSMGGQLTYHFLATYPSFTRSAVIICSSAKTSGHNIQFLEGPRAALENAADSARGLRAFGKAYSAWLTSAEWFDEQLWRDVGFETREAWDEVAAGTNYVDWSGDDLLAMLGMWQRGDITRCTGMGGVGAETTLEDALARIETRVLLMPCLTDQYFRPYVNEREARTMRDARVCVVQSVWGHVVGGGANKADFEWMDGCIRTFLQG